MLFKKTLFVPLWIALLSNVAFAFPVPSLWVGEGSGSDLNTAANWSPALVPGNTAQANFNSGISGIDLAPVATGIFSIGSFNFVEGASEFTFTFDNCEVTFGGTSVGITGSTKNPALNVTNSNHTLLANQLTLGGSVVSDLGSATVTVLNNAVNNSYMIPYQILCSPSPLLMGDDVSWDVRNIATATSDSISSLVTNGQTSFASSFNIGSNATLSFLNRGTAADGASSLDIGDLSGTGSQMSVSGAFTSGDYLSLSFTNAGISGDDTSSNTCGNAGSQGLFGSSFTTGNNSSIVASNSGVSGGASQTAIGKLANDSQFHVAGLFISGDLFTLSLSNSGVNTSNGSGSSSIGVIFGAQGSFDSGLYTGKTGSITVSNSGVNRASLTETCTIGAVAQDQLLMSSDFIANDSLTITATNTGEDIGGNGGVGSNQVGYVGGGQVTLGGSFAIQDDAVINISNAGSATSSVPEDSVGSIATNQMTVGGNFTAGANLKITASNRGSYSGAESGNQIGYVGNDQVLFQSAFYAGNDATITVSNSGSITDGSNNTVGSIQRFPFRCDGAFYVGDSFNLTISNSATNTSSGTTNNVGTLIDGYQAYFGSTFTVADDATITISNSAFYEGTDTTSFVGSMQDQIIIAGAFNGGKNLALTVTNTVTNPNGVTGVGNIIGQIGFQGTCTLGDGTVISATNGGDIAGQISFTGALTVNGSVTLEAINTGTIGSGIGITNSVGGDINIILENSSLIVDNSGTSAPFILGALNGDASSTVTCAQGLIIDTKAGVNATFAGTITSMPALVKQGPGSQTMSGTVDPTSTSTINEGTLNLTGTFIGDIDVGFAGTLTGGGMITGTVINSGITKPTNTLTIAEFINASTGTFDVGISSSQNYLVSSTVDTVLGGGSVLVSSINGTYLFYHPYTVLVSGSSITGTFDSIVAESSLITPVITYSDTAVFVTLRQNTLAAASSANEKNVASVLDSVTSPTLKQSRLISQIVSLPTAKAQDTLDSISGQQYADGAFFAETVNRQFIRRMYDPIRSQVTCNSCAPCCDELTFWSEIGGDFTSIKGTHLNGYQVTAGMQKGICPDWTVGAAISYEGDYIDYSHDGGSQYVNNGLIGVYSLYRPANYYVMTDLAYGYAAGTMDRRIHVGSHIYEAKSHPINSELTFYGEFGGDLKASKKLLIQPFAGLEVDGSWMSSISETAANGWQMRIEGKDHCDVYSRAGLHLTSCKMPKGFLLSVDLAWDYRFTSSNREVDAELALFDGEFEVYGTHLSRSSFEYGFTLLNQISPCWDFYVETTGQVWNRATAFTALAGFGYSW